MQYNDGLRHDEVVVDMNLLDPVPLKLDRFKWPKPYKVESVSFLGRQFMIWGESLHVLA